MDLPSGVMSVIVQNAILDRNLKIWPSARRQLNNSLKAAMGTVPEEPMGALKSIVAEGDLRAFDYRRGSRWWGRSYYLFGLPAAVLAATASATGLVSAAGRIPAAVIALVSAGLTAAATFLNSDNNSKKSSTLSAAWQELADDARIKMLQCAQKLDIDPESDEIFGSQYWSDVIELQRWKSQLLRGEVRERVG